MEIKSSIFLNINMSALYYYVVGTINSGSPILVETFEEYDTAFEFLNALLDLKNEGEDFYITNNYPGDIWQH